MWLEILVAKLVAKVKNLVALAPVLGAILRPAVGMDEMFSAISFGVRFRPGI